MKDKKRLGQFLLFAVVILAFWYGMQPDNPVSNLVYPPSPTPTPDSRVMMGRKVEVGALELTVKEAWRVHRTGDKVPDLGIVTVEFAGMKSCEAEELELCTFNRSKFKLEDVNGKEQLLSQPPGKYIPGFKVVQLAQTRELNQMTSESGQIYFLIDKGGEDFTLIYEGVRLKVMPKAYGFGDVKRNLSTTPGAR